MTVNNTTKVDAYARLDYTTVRDYLMQRGWVRVPYPRDDVLVLRRRDPFAEVVIPADRDLADFVDAMSDAVGRIARSEERLVENVLHDLLAYTLDRHRFAVVGRDTSSGTISFDEGMRLISGAYTALKAAAHAAKKPQRHFPRMSFAEAEEYLAASRLGQTEVGSYVVTVETPVNLESAALSQPDLLESAIPFGRRASTLLYVALDRIVSNLKHGDTDALIDDERALEAGVSANLCRAVLSMAPSDEGADLSISGTWAASFAPPQGIPECVKIDRDLYEPLDKLAARLTPHSLNDKREYLGKVTELHGKPDGEGHTSGEVTLRVFDESEDMPIKARANLGAAEYAIAHQAHMRQHDSLVTLTGILNRSRKLSRFTSVESFQLVSDRPRG